MKKPTHGALLLVVLAMNTPQVTCAENKTIVVTATRLAESPSDVPASVTVLDAEELQRSPVRHVDDALRAAPGIYVLRPLGLGYGLPVQISMRAVPGQNSVLLLADGLPLNDVAGGFETVNEVPIESVRQIDVVRGPFSALYGANAFAGVINVSTLNPEQLPTVSSHVSAGNAGYRELMVMGSGGDSSAGFTVDLNTRQMDNALARDEIVAERWDPGSGSRQASTVPAENYDYDDVRLHSKVMMDIGTSTHIDISGRYSNSKQGNGMLDFRPLVADLVEFDMENESAMLGAVFESELSLNTILKGRAYYRDQQRRVSGLNLADYVIIGTNLVPVFERSQSHTDGRDWFVDAAVDVYQFNRHTITLGADFLRTDAYFSPSYSATTGDPLPLSSSQKAHSTSIGLYAQDRAELTDRLQMVSGIRFDEHSAYGSAISPKVGLLYKAAERTRLRTSIGRAYRAPTMTELYQPDIIFGPVIFRSNPDLKPEYILSADVGIDHDFNNGVSVHTDLFYNDMTDMITKQIDGSVLHYFNTGSAESHGLEAGLGWAFATGSVLSVSYTEQRSENKDTGEDLDHIPNRLLSIGLGFSYPLGASFMASLGVTEQYVGPRTYVGLLSGQRESLQGYWRTDGKFTLSWRDTIWIGAMVENATDTTAQDGVIVNPTLGRFYSLQIGARL